MLSLLLEPGTDPEMLISSERVTFSKLIAAIKMAATGKHVNIVRLPLNNEPENAVNVTDRRLALL